MGFILGLIISALFVMCIILETTGAVRFLFSVILLLGIFALGFVIFTAGLLLTPFFLAGVIVILIFFFIILPLILEGDKKDGK